VFSVGAAPMLYNEDLRRPRWQSKMMEKRRNNVSQSGSKCSNKLYKRAMNSIISPTPVYESSRPPKA
jgi:hypothetical protein